MDNSPPRSTLRSWFAFGLRLLGFWEVLTAAGYFLTGLNVSMGFTKSVTGSWSFGSFMTQTFGHLFLAFWLLTTAPKIARLVYPDPPRQDGDSTKAPPSDTPTI
jgi:hypothetical protein